MPHETHRWNARTSDRHRAIKEYAVRFFEQHKFDAAFPLRNKEHWAVYLHDVELPRHFGTHDLPSWLSIRSWFPKEGYLKDLRNDSAMDDHYLIRSAQSRYARLQGGPTSAS